MAEDRNALGRRLSTAIVLFHEAVGRRVGLRAADHRALLLIEEHGPLTAGELARLTGLTPGAVTGLVDRLIEAGFAGRTEDGADRRRTLITATGARSAELDAAFGEFGRRMGQVMSRYDEREQTLIADFVSNAVSVLREQTARLTAAEAEEHRKITET
ncbi:MarR family transcriptional regulator [Nocardia sp. CDC159]|uniref:MarR family transcriptional regulator n=1 Tax=Nocardia pulmonis TaxID=2951408 RepID=A0A9X2EE54_9NOCA|nr:MULTISPECIES: MarR family transcriptional regulator [Nocardia]MCM6778789.1 MarR family transcriptional regulator [Nocardia pulmonis]MCM6791678.1 MarR family transcriptional regulator [Nocardia sp. CDC159]